MRHITNTIRVPGRFECPPSAMRDYHSPLPGRITLLVNQYDHVTTGTPLYTLDSVEWRRMQQEYINAQAEVLATSASFMMARVAQDGGAAAEEVIHARINAADAHIASVQAAIETANERLAKVQRLQELVGGRLSDLNEARAQLASLRNELSQAREDRAELEQQKLQLSTQDSGAFGTTETLKASAAARRAEYQAAQSRRDLLLLNLQAIAGESYARQLSTATSTDTWTIQPEITIRATAEGVVSTVSCTSGAFIDTAADTLTTVNPRRVRFRGVALQADLNRLHTSMKGTIIKPGADRYNREACIPVTAYTSLEADPQRRTLDIVADLETTQPWARTGVSTELELIIDEATRPQLAIPVACIMRDGLDSVFFRRNPANPDVAQRIKADLGISDGQWIAIHSGAKSGDEIVLDGNYELKLATSASSTKGVHVHADGTIHEGPH